MPMVTGRSLIRSAVSMFKLSYSDFFDSFFLPGVSAKNQEDPDRIRQTARAAQDALKKVQLGRSIDFAYNAAPEITNGILRSKIKKRCADSGCSILKTKICQIGLKISASTKLIFKSIARLG